MTLKTPLSELPKIGPKTAAKYANLGLEKVADLINHAPNRYLDFSKTTTIDQAKPGQLTIKAKITNVRGRYARYRGLHLTEALASDQTGSLRLIWFGQPFRPRSLQEGGDYFISGLYDLKYKHLQMVNPRVELVSGQSPTLIAPIYPETKGLKSWQIHQALKVVRPLIEGFPEPWPAELVKQAGIASYAQTLADLHFPQKSQSYEKAQLDLGLRELVELSLSSQLLSQAEQTLKATPIQPDHVLLKKITNNLGFQLTDQQREITWKIIKAMAEANKPINRLLQGDTGAGKTVVAALVAANVVTQGRQVAFLAPTQLLAQQHHQTLCELIGQHLPPKTICLLTASQDDRSSVVDDLATGQPRLVVGTHALFAKDLVFDKLDLVVIDEQHRFGVDQRQKLIKKAAAIPHVLSMSATPIPRSLALVLYADLVIDRLTDKPPGRQEPETKVIALNRRFETFKQVFRTLDAKNQAYVVCPAIDSDIGDAIADLEPTIKKACPNLSYAVVHAKQETSQIDKTMRDFRDGRYHLLLATTIIGFGLDIPTARHIFIMSPHRFGLAQLHQLRGRVGRTDRVDTCYLCLNDDQPASARLKALENCSDGFELSDLDLDQRGPGAIYGRRQSGVLDLKFARLTDRPAIDRARKLATELIESGQKLSPALQNRIKRYQAVTNLN